MNNDGIMPERIKLILEWLLSNEATINSSGTVKILMHIKGKSVAGEITVLPDSKK